MYVPVIPKTRSQFTVNSPPLDAHINNAIPSATATGQLEAQTIALVARLTYTWIQKLLTYILDRDMVELDRHTTKAGCCQKKREGQRRAGAPDARRVDQIGSNKRH